MSFWICAILLMTWNLASLLSNLLLLPGNWFMTASAAAFVLAAGFDHGPNWTIVIVSASLAGAGEVLELVLGSARAAKKGASRRAVLLSLVFSVVGSLAGTFLVPIPLIGSAIGAVLGAAGGAYLGAWLGEAWIGTTADKRNEIGAAAMSGRLLGMLAKVTMGVAIFAIQLVSLFT